MTAELPVTQGVTSYDHSVVLSVDMIWDLEFYEDLFGARLLPRSRGRHRQKGERPCFVNFAVRPIKQGRCPIIFMDVARSVWGLFLQLDFPPQPERMLQGPRHGFAVAERDFDDALRVLEEMEIDYTGPVEHDAASPLTRSAYFKDPSGNSLEISVERKPPALTPPVTDGRIKVTRLLHLALDVTDLDRAEDVYVSALGLHSLGRGTAPDGAEQSVLAFPNGQLLTLQKVARITDRNAWPTMGKIHSGLIVQPADWQTVEAKLRRRGFEIMPDFVKGDDLRLEDQHSIYFADHDNNIIQLFTPKSTGAR